jgi:pyridoxal phosphate enzyme (YggS family)
MFGFSMVRENVAIVKGRIAAACHRVGRNPSDITLVAVAKTFSEAQVEEAVNAGVKDIGENYVQELLRKKDRLGNPDIRWHFIGHLQSNKARYVADWIFLVHVVDTFGLAEEIHRRAAKAGRVVDILVEVNTTGEPSKFGVSPGEAVKFVQTLAPLSNLCVAGYMTIGPFLPDPEGSRPMFRRLRELKEETARLTQENVAMRHLSMGMTGDFEVAIEEGATILRIGTGIFGSRVAKH